MTLLIKYKKITTTFFCLVFSISLLGQEQSQSSAIIDTMSFITIDGESDGDYFGESLSYAGDLNGDGFNDFIIGAPRNDRNFENAGCAYIYFGGNTISKTPDLILPGEIKGGLWGESVSYAGDVNGDGFDDVIVGGFNTKNVKIYFGSYDMDSIPDLIFPVYGRDVSYAGDFNADGFDDVIIGDQGYDSNGSNNGRAYLYFGGALMDTIPDHIFDGEAAFINFGASVSYAGDLNNDGFDDIMISAPGYRIENYYAGRIFLFYGNSQQDTVPDVVITGPHVGVEFGYHIAPARDVNNDGFEDIIVGGPWCNSAPGLSHFYIYYGGENMDSIVDIIITDQLFCYGWGVSSAGDINHDGFDDVMVGGTGSVNFYYGNTNMDSIADYRIQNNNMYKGFGESISFLGDINADGNNEYLIGEPYYSTTEKYQAGRVYIYTTGKITGIKDIIKSDSFVQIYPNPFNTTTTVEFNIQKPEKVVLKIFNSVGQEIETLVNNFQTTGTHRIEWQPGNLPSGLYYCHFQTSTISETKKLLLKN